jgi:hypothetical protein
MTGRARRKLALMRRKWKSTLELDSEKILAKFF